MKAKLQKDYRGKTVRSLKLGDSGPYEPTTLSIVFTDGSSLYIGAGSIMYDQYGSSPCLEVSEHVPAPVASPAFAHESRRCPGVGATPLHRTYGNPSAACPACGRSVRLTKRSTIRYHKSKA